MNKSKWIAIEDRLPEVNVPVLVCGRPFYGDAVLVVSVASRNTDPCNNWAHPWSWNTSWINGIGSDWDMDAITHWQPLPDLPEEE